MTGPAPAKPPVDMLEVRRELEAIEGLMRSAAADRLSKNDLWRAIERMHRLRVKLCDAPAIPSDLPTG